MNLQKSKMYGLGSYSHFLLLLTYLLIYCDSTQGRFGMLKTGVVTKGSSAWRHSHERVRRQLSGYCSSQRQCTGNGTVFLAENSNNCYCDEACFKIFSDCCPDYERQCGSQKTLGTELPDSKWKCVEFDWSPISPCKLEGVTGVWMINKCQPDSSFNELRPKCENVSTKLPYPLEDFIPVVGVNDQTYRNKYCALCNGVKNYTTWDIGVFTYIIPPEDFDLDSRLRFIEKNGGSFKHITPRGMQPRRYCFGANYIDNCSSAITDRRLINGCVEGPVEVVTNDRFTYFKNFACALCNEYRDATTWKTAQVCEPPLPEGFSVVFSLQDKKLTTTVLSNNCPSGTVYDTNLKFCREGYIISSSGELTNEYLILLWFKPQRNIRTEINSKLENDLRSALSTHFSLQVNQVSKMIFNKQDDLGDLFVATFRITLTPFQTLVMANQNKTNLNATLENTAFLKLFNFSGNFSLVRGNTSFSVVKVISKQLSCYGESNFQSHEYKIDRENGILVVNKTGKVYLLDDYTLIARSSGNITLCSKLVISDCIGGSYIPLDPDEYVIFPNLTLYYNGTGGTFNFGEYLIDEILNKGHGNLSNNSSISICLPFSNTFNTTETNYSRRRKSEGIRILTSICFSVSIICLILLFITYGLFSVLRTVPGMNLMNLSLSMLLGNFVWLIGTTYFTGTSVCEGFAILEHYFVLVSFLAMSIISFHSWKVFSQPIAGRITNQSRRRFIKYSICVWSAPALFVAVCVILDKTKTLLVDYGTDCWLGTTRANLYLFLLPIALLLLYNIYTFIRTGISLSRHEKNRQILHRKEGKQNLLICTKLATLVGFPWLFAFFGVLFPGEEAFEYVFVIFVCMQGLYIGMAFVFNEKNLKLYKNWLNTHSGGNRSSSGTASFEMAHTKH